MKKVKWLSVYQMYVPNIKIDSVLYVSRKNIQTNHR